MASILPFTFPGTMGNIAGGASDGVLVGALTATNPTKALLKAKYSAGLCITEDASLYVDETTPFGESTGDDVEVLPATPAVDDAVYYGHATTKFNAVYQNITTSGDGDWTIVWEYWNGSAWASLAGLTDGTTAFEAGTGWVSTTFTSASDWEKCLIDGVNGYWIRARVSVYTSVTTAPQVGQGYIAKVGGDWTDDTTDFTDAGAGDVKLLPDAPAVGDGLYVGYSEKFCKLKITTSQARTGTATITLKYWDGSAWTAVTATLMEDDSVGYSATAGIHYIHFVPPSDWVANTATNGPNGEAGFFVVMELTALTDVTQQPLATQGWVLPLVTGASGVKSPASASVFNASLSAGTASATNNDSVLLVINTTTGTYASMTWSKGVAFVNTSGSFSVAANDELALVQITEDGTTEFASVFIPIAF